ncbi:MAG: hypothetical protein A3G75_01055 [Verrucomicrobia bacterium RIFCSPLOWO2_12_FULL_64_8]|nr:MAG: hypothetical protein A3G75_01055 [Verrucomicrobia bacterium RIFCSPLOWO2_12_FULL_64_8]
MHQDKLPAAGLTRRALFKQAGLGVLGVSALDLLGGESSAYAAPAPAAPSPLAALNRFPRTVQEYFVRRVPCRLQWLSYSVSISGSSRQGADKRESFHWGGAISRFFEC